MLRRALPASLIVAALTILTSCTGASPVSSPSSEAPPTPSSSPSATSDAESLIDDCVEHTTQYFAGEPGADLTFHRDRAQFNTLDDGTWRMYIPVTDTSPELVAPDLAAVCYTEPGKGSEIFGGGQIPMNEQELADYLAGVDVEFSG